MKWNCGVLCGFILALLLGAALFYFFYLRKNPEVTAESIEKIETQWDKTKDTGDKVIENMKPRTSGQKKQTPATEQ